MPLRKMNPFSKIPTIPEGIFVRPKELDSQAVTHIETRVKEASFCPNSMLATCSNLISDLNQSGGKQKYEN